LDREALSPTAAVVDDPSVNAVVTAPSHFARRLFLILGTVALVYAFLSGLRTVSDPDLGWQMASGRWIAQHRHIPSTDVFSYTAAGSPWVYPGGAELLFYGLYRLGGFALLSWLGALTCTATVAILLRRGSAATAAVAILAIPLISQRTSPRAEMFTVLLFAAYLSLLWENYQTGRARLMWLPLLMIAWVNLHLGFVAGLALIGGFTGLDVLEMLLGARRRSAALARLTRGVPWFAATAAATLVNPWGWKLYGALARQNRAMTEHAQYIAEWASARWNWHATIHARPSFIGEPMQYTLIVVTGVVIVTVVLALVERRPGEAIFVAGALWATMRYVRMEALSASVLIVVAGAVLGAAALHVGRWLPNPRIRQALACTLALVFAVIGVYRGSQFVSNRIYLPARTSFGTGLSWWFPNGAAEFVRQNNLPAEVFNTFNEGGFIVWKLSDRYRDYMDGRAVPFGAGAFERERHLLASPLDSPRWQQEAERYNINTLVFHLASKELEFAQLPDLCYSQNWRPVYLDEISIVLVRRSPATEKLINRLQINCANAPVPAAPLDHKSHSFGRWLNSAYVLAALNRPHEALAAAEAAEQIDPASGSVHWVRGNVLYAESRRAEAEEEWLKALKVASADNAAVWSRLAELYTQQGRVQDALGAWQQTVALTTDPATKAKASVQAARLYLAIGHTHNALKALDVAASAAPPEMLSSETGRSFAFDVAQGRSTVWARLGDTKQAISFGEEAVRLDPEAPDAWWHLAKLYDSAGRKADAQRAEERAKSLAAEKKP